MIVMPMQPNAVYVGVVTNGCCKAGFDSTFPAQLNGIITPDEFRESIDKINGSSGSKVPIIIAGLILLVTFIAGVALFIAGGVRAATSGSFGFPVLVGVGMGVILFGMIVSVVVCCIVQVKAANKLQEAIAQESAKYSSRSSKPCSWRLNTTTTTSGSFDHRHTTTTRHLIIDIGNAGPSMNGNSFQPPPVISNYNQAAGGFCSQCGAPRKSPTAKFCSSCSQPFNKF